MEGIFDIVVDLANSHKKWSNAEGSGFIVIGCVNRGKVRILARGFSPEVLEIGGKRKGGVAYWHDSVTLVVCEVNPPPVRLLWRHMNDGWSPIANQPMHHFPTPAMFTKIHAQSIPEEDPVDLVDPKHPEFESVENKGKGEGNIRISKDKNPRRIHPVREVIILPLHIWICI
eukprot:Gb_34812 [translate_table: standard]